jgi:hypothetical protein
MHFSRQYVGQFIHYQGTLMRDDTIWTCTQPSYKKVLIRRGRKPHKPVKTMAYPLKVTGSSVI